MHPPWIHNKHDKPVPFYRVGELKQCLEDIPDFWRAIILCPFHALLILRPSDEAWIHHEMLSMTNVEDDAYFTDEC